MHECHQKMSCIICVWMSKLEANSHENACFFSLMVLECREREHDDVDRVSQCDENDQKDLRGHGIYTFGNLGS